MDGLIIPLVISDFRATGKTNVRKVVCASCGRPLKASEGGQWGFRAAGYYKSRYYCPQCAEYNRMAKQAGDEMRFAIQVIQAMIGGDDMYIENALTYALSKAELYAGIAAKSLLVWVLGNPDATLDEITLEAERVTAEVIAERIGER